MENNNSGIDREVEEITFETRFLFNIMMDLLVKKNVITEEEFRQEYESALAKIENNTKSSKN